MIVFKAFKQLLRRKMKYLTWALALLIGGALFSSAGHAEPNGRMAVDFVYELGEARLDHAEQILRSAADYLASNPSTSPSEGHVAFKRILNKSRVFRSILALDENGMLVFDSYNPVPFSEGMDLSGRDYFSETTNAAAMTIRLFPRVVGQQSGETFIPVAMAVPQSRNQNQRVVTLVVPPSSLMPNIQFCAICGVAIASGGRVVASSRPMSEVNEAALSRISFEGEYGARQILVRRMPVLVHWRKSPRNDLVYMYYEAAASMTE
jgi:hypothetical protein